MERLIFRTITAAFAFATFFNVKGQDFNTGDLKKHVHYLASDKLGGRAAGTKGERLAYEYIQHQFLETGLIPKGDSGFLQHFTYTKKTNPHDSLGGKTIHKTGVNVIGFLDNNAKNTIVIGAHYDHLGRGESGTSLGGKKSKKIHNGADDNASGTAGVIELARYFSENNIKENNNFLFICFSAEEDGIIGSKYFTAYPTLNMDEVNFMYNMDMIGRLNDSTKKLMIYGIGTSPSFSDVFAHNDLTIITDSSGIGSSDHTSFYLKNIPSIHFFTGQHKDYHKPSDDADKINYQGMQEVLKLIATSVEKLDESPKLAFTPTKHREQKRSGFKVTLGVMPDYTFEGKGMRIDAVTDGKPGDIAGIKGGDIIQAINQEAVEDIYAYMDKLSKFNKGDEAIVTVLRKNELLSLTVKF